MAEKLGQINIKRSISKIELKYNIIISKILSGLFEYYILCICIGKSVTLLL